MVKTMEEHGKGWMKRDGETEQPGRVFAPGLSVRKGYTLCADQVPSGVVMGREISQMRLGFEVSMRTSHHQPGQFGSKAIGIDFEDPHQHQHPTHRSSTRLDVMCVGVIS